MAYKTLNSIKQIVRILAIPFLYILILKICLPYPAHAASMTDIRIGLVDLYKDKSRIMVYNSRITLGFCVNNSYSAEIELDSTTGLLCRYQQLPLFPKSGEYLRDI